jgi:Acetyltransferase (GNAT) domain
MGIVIDDLGPEDDAELTVFLDAIGANSPSVLGYHYPFYRDMLAKIGIGEPHYLGARKNARLVGYLPAFMRKTGAGTVLSSLPYFGPNGGVLCVGETRKEAHEGLLAEIGDRARKANALGCSIYTPFLFADFELYDRSLRGWTIVNKFTQYRLLSDDVQDPAVGWSLRKAQRLGVEVLRDVVTPEHTAAFFAIYVENCREFGIPPKSRDCVELLTGPDLLGKHTHLYTAYREGKMLGGLLMIWSPFVASYYMPCSLTEARSLQPTTALIDAAMRDAREHGIRFWNWESSPGRDSGVYRFKKNWGGAIESEYRIYVESFAGREQLVELGSEAIVREFPHFFVWPFDRLEQHGR